MKIALIGNMNNNHFSLLRYFTDLNLDCDLLIFRGEISHFHPSCDTHDYERWQPHIRQLSITNGGIDILMRKKEDLRREFHGYDYYIGNGITPALFKYLKLKLDLFVPYGNGIEFIIDCKTNYKKPFRSIYKIIKKKFQQDYLSKQDVDIISSDFSEYNLSTFKTINRTPIPLDLPMVYIERHMDLPFNEHLEKTVDRMIKADIVVFSHVSHMWKTLPEHVKDIWVGKRNDWLIKGFASFIGRSKGKNHILVLFEYGPDYPNSKKLISDLGIDKHVVWLPKLERKIIMNLLKYATIGGSEYSGELWGGAGWEFLASGIPMFHKLDNPQEFVEIKGIPLPYFFNVSSELEIAEILLKIEPNIDEFEFKKNEVKAWFLKYNSHHLARKYVDLIMSKS